MAELVKFMTFVMFLESKEIKNEAFEEMSDEEQLKLFQEHSKNQEAYIESLKNDLEDKASKEDIEKAQAELKEMLNRENKALKEILSTQGKALTKILKNIKGGVQSNSEKAQIDKFLEDNSDEIKSMYEAGKGFIELEVKAPESMTTGSATNPDGIPEIVGVQQAPPSNVNLRGVIVDALVTIFNTNQRAYPYTESVPKEGDFDWTAEGGIKPQIDFKIETRYAEPKKVAAHMKLTEEAVDDIPSLQSIANNFLKAKHDLKRQNGILFGDGLGENLLGATAYGRMFVAGPMANCVVTPNFMDTVNACITDIFTTHNYQDEMPYMANIVLVNPFDFFCEVVSAKDANGLPLYPTASLFNRVIIGNVLIVPFEDIPAGKLFVSDMSKYNVTNYKGYTVRVGWINDDFIRNQFCIVGESRLHGFVKNLDEQAFIYDDFATVKAAITKP